MRGPFGDTAEVFTHAGVNQGDITSPLLWNLVINAMLQRLAVFLFLPPTLLLCIAGPNSIALACWPAFANDLRTYASRASASVLERCPLHLREF